MEEITDQAYMFDVFRLKERMDKLIGEERIKEAEEAFTPQESYKCMFLDLSETKIK